MIGRDYIPKQVALSGVERQAVVARVRTTKRWHGWLCAVSVAGAIIFAVVILLQPWVWIVRLAGLVSPVLILVMAPLAYSGARETVTKQVLRDMGHRICSACGYWLRGLAKDDLCPECGAKYEPEAATPAALMWVCVIAAFLGAYSLQLARGIGWTGVVLVWLIFLALISGPLIARRRGR